MKLHRGEKLFVCKQFTTADSLHYHMRIDTGENQLYVVNAGKSLVSRTLASAYEIAHWRNAIYM